MDKIQEILSEMKSGIYDFTKDGECSNCGRCCSRYLPVSLQDIEAIRRYIKKHKIKEQKHFIPTAGYMVDFTCPFRDKGTRTCVIYPVRPAICKDFRCDKPKNKINADKAMYHGKYSVIDMKLAFFGG